MKLLIQILVAIGVAAAGYSSPRDACPVCAPKAIAQPSCDLEQPGRGGVMRLVSGVSESMTCYCNCCKVTKNGRGEDVQSCVKKTLAHKLRSDDSETCECHCPIVPGPKGVRGCQGPSGIGGGRGEDGLNGVPGVNGIHGKPGYGGQHGKDGASKPDCEDGNDGRTGIKGVPGKDGRQGGHGHAGRHGEAGKRGSSGPSGLQGGMGPKGRPGPPGSNGHRGPAGPAGRPGQPGNMGAHGNRGPAGASGKEGKPGAQGMAGGQGRPGQRGAAGARGANGAPGARGRSGAAGVKGQAGRNGRDSSMRGHPGAPGDNGRQGEAGDDAVFEWAHIEVMVANMLWKKLTKPSQYCGEFTEICKCGNYVPYVPPVIIEEPSVPEVIPQKPVLDMVLVVDGSESLDSGDWGALKEFLVKFIHSFSLPEFKDKYAATSAMVIVQFSSGRGSEDDYIIEQGTMDQLNQLEKELNSMFQLRQGTDTFAALEFVVNKVIPEKMDKFRGLAHSDVEHVRQLILIVNGEPNDADFNSEYNQRYNVRTLNNHQLIRALDDSFSDRYVIGVGSNIKAHASSYKQIVDNRAAQGMWKIESYSNNGDNRKSSLNHEFLETIVSVMTNQLI